MDGTKKHSIYTTDDASTRNYSLLLFAQIRIENGTANNKMIDVHDSDDGCDYNDRDHEETMTTTVSTIHVHVRCPDATLYEDCQWIYYAARTQPNNNAHLQDWHAHRAAGGECWRVSEWGQTIKMNYIKKLCM